MRIIKFVNASLLLMKKNRRSVGNLLLIKVFKSIFKLDVNVFPAYNDTYFTNYVWLKNVILNSIC